MDNFIKHISKNIPKPTTELEAPTSQLFSRMISIMFNFPNFYYCNTNLFHKPENTLQEMAKSLLVLNSFPKELDVLNSLVEAFLTHAHIYDIYFSPIGWLVGISNESTKYHALIKITSKKDIADSIFYNIISKFDVIDIDIKHNTTSTISRFSFIDKAQPAPIAVLTFYPFLPEKKVMIIIYLGRYHSKHCGLIYLTSNQDIYKVARKIYAYVKSLYLISDNIASFTTIHIKNINSQVKPLPENFCYSLCEILYNFNTSIFEETSVPIPTAKLFVPKQLISIINLPCDTLITCLSLSTMDIITHIDNKKLDRILVIVKDKFLNNVLFNGVFKKTNLVRHKKYTHTVIFSTFPCPTLKETKSMYPSTCQKVLFNEQQYITKTFNDIL